MTSERIATQFQSINGRSLIVRVKLRCYHWSELIVLVSAGGPRSAVMCERVRRGWPGLACRTRRHARSLNDSHWLLNPTGTAKSPPRPPCCGPGVTRPSWTLTATRQVDDRVRSNGCCGCLCLQLSTLDTRVTYCSLQCLNRWLDSIFIWQLPQTYRHKMEGRLTVVDSATASTRICYNWNFVRNIQNV